MFSVRIKPEIAKESSVSSKPTFPPAVSLATTTDFVSSPAVLVVGGTDGSGTRRVVQILTELGVRMVSEDPETYDIHADIVGGWPKIVSPVLSATHTVNFQPKELDMSLRNRMTRDIDRLLHRLHEDSSKPPSNKLAVGGVLPKPPHIQAKHVQYGFKAPVAMTLLPYWVHSLPSSMFIHVLRDGRDIAFSANQGPVQKFYTDMYRSNREAMALKPSIKSVKLWSDWNSDAYHFAKAIVQDKDHAQRTIWSKDNNSGGGSGGGAFGYFQLHSEDLVSPNRQVRFAAIYHLAKFVGSTITNDEMCCLAMEDSEFMGSHDRSTLKRVGGDKQSEAQVSSRYGKWKMHTDHDPELRSALYKHGRTGLKLFGYEPLRAMATAEMVTPDGTGYHCQLNTTTCKKKEEEMVDHFISAIDWSIPGKCEANYGFDYVGADIKAVSIKGNDQRSCCKACLQTPGCHVFTIDPTQDLCFLKSAELGRKFKKHLISGKVLAMGSV